MANDSPTRVNVRFTDINSSSPAPSAPRTESERRTDATDVTGATAASSRSELPSDEDNNHLRLPVPLDPVTLPVKKADPYGVVFHQQLMTPQEPDTPLPGESGCFCLFRRRARRRFAAEATSSAATPSVNVKLDVASKVSLADMAPAQAKLPSPPSPELKGMARSPFVDGLRSVSREGPGRLVRAIASTSRRAASKAGVAFSVHA